MSEKWTATEVPDQTGRVALITGANSGIGLVAARELARAGAHVVMAVRNVAKGNQAAASIAAGDVEVQELDLADLSSVRAFAERYEGDLDLLINNAGVMAPPRRLTNDGFESQLGTNHLGHFALTGLLLARLLAREAPRVVTVSSGAHRIGQINFDDLHGERRYNNWRWYGQSKLANLMFAFELQRRATEAGTALKSLAVHPGYARTNLQFAAPRWYEQAVMAITNLVLAQSGEMGALPTLYAATVPEVPDAAFVGPNGFMEQRGYPQIVTAAGKAYDEQAWRRLWELSEELTGVSFQFSAPAASSR